MKQIVVAILLLIFLSSVAVTGDSRGRGPVNLNAGATMASPAVPTPQYRRRYYYRRRRRIRRRRYRRVYVVRRRHYRRRYVLRAR